MNAKRAKRGSGAAQGRILRLNLTELRATDPNLAQALAGPIQGRHLRTGRDRGRVTNLFQRHADGAEVAWYATNAAGSLEQLMADTELRGASVLMLLGVGLGHELAALATDPGFHFRHIFVVEPDLDVLRVAFRATNLTPALKRPGVQFFAGPSMEALTSALHGIWTDLRLLRLCGTVAVATADGARRFQGGFHAAAEAVVAQSISAAVARMGNSTLDALMGLENTLRNLPRVVETPSLAQIAGALAGRPAVVASAGPSLSRQFDHLRRIQDDVLIVCPDTCYRALVSAGIEPHLVTSRERTPYTTLHFVGVPTTRSRLAGLTVLNPDVFEAFQGDCLPIHRAASHSPWLWPDRPSLVFQGSSGNQAYVLAALLGCDPILLVGQDLAFGADGTTHTQDTALGDRQERYGQEPRIEVNGYGGRPAQTTLMWHRLRLFLEADVAAHSGRTVNCTEGGARIAGTTEQPFADAIAQHVRRPDGPSPQEILDGRLASVGAEDRQVEAQRLHGLITAAQRDLGAIDDQCTAALAMVGPASQGPHPAELDALPPDVSTVLAHPPCLQLQQLREKLARSPGFENVVIPCAQPLMVPWEIGLYAQQRQAANGAELCALILPRLEIWFQGIQVVVQGVREVLAWGEQVLHAAHASLPPPMFGMPSVSTTDLWKQANPRREDQWSDPSVAG